MKSIGIRVEPSEIYYVILELEDGGNFRFLPQKLVLPKALNDDIPKQLSFIRNTLFSIICEYDIQYAGLKTTEGLAQTPSVFRMNIEGVIQELFADSTIKTYFAGTYNSIAARVSNSSTTIKESCKGENNILGIDNWGDLNQKYRECIFCALAATNYQIGGGSNDKYQSC
ncbi:MULTISPECIES: hypothetical protein [Bacillus amyloliquefaciens group]|uniref:hypothetical protein n=1 Tax=Bacillus amyloliquefaciens group TaxID=1938374 RepID=UPI000B51CECE|nr:MULTISPECIES: hypothetical protein [Bacillus amyloliquefaciens group]MDQ8092541.1 hypothetical protein [Bacillus amyloliquefaciens]